MPNTLESLEKAIRRHQQLYDQGNPEISDAEFDALLRQLEKLNPKHPLLDSLGDSVTRDTIRHGKPMLSLGKCYTDQEYTKWLKGLNYCGKIVLQPKYDGISVILRYDQDGNLKTAATRGGGFVGDDITANFRLVPGVPHKIDEGNVEIRGELVIHLYVFDSKYAKVFENPRNMISGTVLRKHGDKSALYDLTFIAYDAGNDAKSIIYNIKWLRQNGFSVGWSVPCNWKNSLDLIKKHLAMKVEYAIDGWVAKVDDPKCRQQLGATSHHPRWAIAYKLQGESGSTTLEDVEWQVSRTGTVSPVAIVKAVKLSGASVRRATLHHAAHARALGLTKGATILMTRRGGVIPHVEAVTAHGTEKIAIPIKCPSCRGLLVWDGDFLLCRNSRFCSAIVRGRLRHWADRTGMMGFGEGIIEKLHTEAVLTTPADFYTLDQFTLSSIDGFGDGLSAKLINEIAQTRKLTAEKFLRGIGIDGIGQTIAARVLKQVGGFEKLFAWAREPKRRILGVNGVGNVIENALWMGLRENSALIIDLLEHVTIEDVAPAKKAPKTGGPAQDNGGAFAGKKVVFTGGLTDMSREEAQQMVRDLGGETPPGLTRDIDILVVGDLAKEHFTGKRDKAAKYNAKGSKIEILTEEEWTKRLAEELAKGLDS